MESAVRVPTPEPDSGSKRKRTPSPSPPPRHRRRYSSRSPPRSPPVRNRNGDLPRDVDHARAVERQRQLEMRLRKTDDNDADAKPLTDEQKQAAAKAEYEKLLNMRSGGTYIPPAKLRALQAQITDKTSKEYQRMAWEALKKSINGLINKVNVSNIKHIVPELFSENLIRGRGLFCRSIMKAQAASLPFTPIYAAMAAIVNTKLPQVGELLGTRLTVQFKKAFRRNDKAVCLSSTMFIAHLSNQQVIHEFLPAQILLTLLNKPTDDSVEIAVGLTREVGQHMEQMNQKIAMMVFDQFRRILHEADIDKRTQYMIEVLFQVRKDRYKDNPAIKDELDLVEEEDQITHEIRMDDEDLATQDTLNIFKYDEEWQEHEDAYKKLKAEILGEGDEDDEDEYETDESEEDEEDDKDRDMEIKDQTNTDLVNLRRTIYLTIKSSGGFEECCHKLMRINLPPGKEEELPSMIIECASQERTYDKFYGLIGERLCKLNRLWMELFEAAFMRYYETIHRYESNRLRIVAQFFAHLLSSDAVGWHVMSAIHLNEEETTSSSRIFIKILFEELSLAMGQKQLAARMRDDVLQESFENILPKDVSKPRNTRFAINFFTAIGMGVVTEDMRRHLENLPPPPALEPPRAPSRSSRSRSSSVSSYSSYTSDSRSRSRSYSRSRSRSRSPSRRGRGRRYSSVSDSRSRSSSRSNPRPGRRRARSYSSTPSRTPSRSASPDRGRGRGRGRSHSESRTPSRSRSPPRRNGVGRSRDRSPSRTPPRRSRGGANGSLSRDLPPKRRRNTNSTSRSQSPPPRQTGRGR